MNEAAGSNGPPFLAVHGISKSFPGVQALLDVHLQVSAGEALALIGENGAGKSTLMKIVGRPGARASQAQAGAQAPSV